MEKISREYKIAQDYKYVKEDWWKWWIWIEGEGTEIDNIEYVVYTLHSTFVNPVRKIDDRSTNFRLQAEGWGIFTIYARLFLKDQSQITLEHDLFLKYPDGSENMA